jgi:hypothetical protein
MMCLEKHTFTQPRTLSYYSLSVEWNHKGSINWHLYPAGLLMLPLTSLETKSPALPSWFLRGLLTVSSYLTGDTHKEPDILFHAFLLHKFRSSTLLNILVQNVLNYFINLSGSSSLFIIYGPTQKPSQVELFVPVK